MKINRFFLIFYIMHSNLIISSALSVLNPKQLITSSRFDVMAKYIYAKYYRLGVKCQWARELYAAHLKNWNGFQEHLPEPSFPHFHCTKEYKEKNNLNDFIRSFEELLDSINNSGFDKERSLLPITKTFSIIDGAHRLGAALAYNVPVVAEIIPSIDESTGFNADFFAHIGLKKEYLDTMALEYARLKKDTYLISVFPAVQGRKNQIRAILNEYGKIVYQKKINLFNNGIFNYIRLLCDDEGCIGSWQNSFAGVKNKMTACFSDTKGVVDIVLYECANVDLVKQAKQKICKVFGIEDHSIYINYTHNDTVRLAEVTFNENGIHWLNHAVLQRCQNFEKYLQEYKDLIRAHNIDVACCCVDSGAVMAAYGIRDCRDLDILHVGYNGMFMTQNIRNHNEEIKYHAYAKEDIIFNPNNYFWYKGLKFVSLKVLYAMKFTRNEIKDLKDCKLIEQLLEKCS